ncbi:G coupled receptor like [Fusarium albosuccineum]|uniref:G coupled receptor like n=1 Tax=Fusarium albosuccineum TaxID=1237068 RepID=A0A8H4PJF2_9HYPO|nr:G coupled receptor like [Fusarium albosuccineum]
MLHKFVSGRAEALTAGQTQTLVLMERIGGSISLVAVVLIFVAYALVPRVRNVQNTFIVFASIANVGASIASIIAMDGLELGVASPLCQAQSFMFHMFMQSDPWWSLAMAFNVFLVFFFRTSPDAFRKWWWLYCLICYGGPFIIALSLLLVRNPHRGLVYGQATPRVDLLSVPQDCFYGTILTEVQVVHSTAASTALPTEPKPAHLQQSTPHVSFDEPPPPIQTAPSQYFSTVTSPAGNRARQESPLRRITSATNNAVNKFVIEDPIKRAYLRTSFLFALSVLVTWIPSSLNRIHSWLVGTSPYEYHVATAAVLPLQGLWNAVIFFVTSATPMKDRVKGLFDSGRSGEMVETGGGSRSTAENPDEVPRTGEESFLDDTESGSDVELRRMGEAPGKRSASL